MRGKLALRWTPSAHTDATLRYAQQDYRDGAALWGSPGAPRATVASGTPSWNRSVGRSASLAVRHDFESGLRLSSVTAWNDFRDRVQQDTDFRPPTCCTSPATTASATCRRSSGWKAIAARAGRRAGRRTETTTTCATRRRCRWA